MKTTKEKIVRLFITYLISLLYPLFKYIQKGSLVPASDACVYMGLVLLIIGLINILVNMGTFDPMAYILKRNFQNYTKTYEVYSKDIEDKKKDSFNYPLYHGILLMITSYVISLFC